jgi:glycosyltransferase involved in cell wall biosynthesis
MYGAIKPYIAEDLKSRWNSTSSTLHILGNRPFCEIIADMCRCGVFILPTYSEGFPNVILESMACGCAIVTTPVGAIPEMLEEKDGKHYGIMVEPRNVNQLRNAIDKMLSDAKFRTECEANVKQRVNERYNIESVWRKMVEMWRSTISNS